MYLAETSYIKSFDDQIDLDIVSRFETNWWLRNSTSEVVVMGVMRVKKRPTSSDGQPACKLRYAVIKDLGLGFPAGKCSQKTTVAQQTYVLTRSNSSLA
jgi:hypothetical protein